MLTYLAGRNTIKKEKTVSPMEALDSGHIGQVLKMLTIIQSQDSNMSVLLQKTAKSTPAHGMQLKRNAKNIKSSFLVLIKCKGYFIRI